MATSVGRVDGYPKLAETMVTHPDLVTVRRFDDMSTETILFLQGKLAMLEWKWKRLQEEDKSGNLFTSWWLLEKSARDGNSEPLELISEIRETLHYYSKCIRGSEL